MNKDEWLTVTEAARFLGVSRSTLYRWSKMGKLPIYRIGIRVSRIKRKDIARMLEEAKPLHGGE